MDRGQGVSQGRPGRSEQNRNILFLTAVAHLIVQLVAWSLHPLSYHGSNESLTFAASLVYSAGLRWPPAECADSVWCSEGFGGHNKQAENHKTKF